MGREKRKWGMGWGEVMPIPTFEQSEPFDVKAHMEYLAKGIKNSQEEKNAALTHARALLYDLRFRTDWNGEQSVNAAIEHWFELWEPLYIEERLTIESSRSSEEAK